MNEKTPFIKSKTARQLLKYLAIIIAAVVLVYLYSFITQSMRKDISEIKLDESQVNFGGYFESTGEGSESAGLRSAVQEFYDETGVAIFVYDVTGSESTEALDDVAKAYYAENFTDEGHLLIVVKAAAGSYEIAFFSGKDAEIFFDEDGIEFLSQYIKAYYETDGMINQAISDGIKGAQSAIVTNAREGNSSTILIIVIIAALVVYSVYSFKKNKKKVEQSME